MSVDAVVASSSDAIDVCDGDLARFVEEDPWMNRGGVEGGKVVKGELRGPNA